MIFRLCFMKNVHPHWEIYSGNGPYLLLVHGFLSSRGQWLPNLEALSRVTTPVMVELFGHGRSPSPSSPEAYHPESYVRYFEDIRRRLGVSTWFVCGQSPGGKPHYAICAAASGIGDGPGVDQHRGGALAEKKALSDSPIKGFAKELIKGGPKLLESLPMHPIHARFLREDVQSALIEDTANADMAGIANTLRFTMPEVSVRDEIYNNQVPALLVCGKWEKRFEVFREFAKQHMPHLDIVDLDAGHAVNVGAAKEFNRSVTDFVCRHAKKRSPESP